jgi:hypothetical protein
VLSRRINKGKNKMVNKAEVKQTEEKSKIELETEQLIQKYNAEAGEQFQRLCRLFHILKVERKGGGRRVEFSNGEHWSANNFHFSDKFDKRLTLNRFNLQIDSIKLGEEKRHEDSKQ